MKTKAATLLILIITLLGCGKDNITVNGALTSCPANCSCQYIYYDHTAVINADLISPGQNRVFLYQSINKSICDGNTALYFITPVSDNDFDITSAQIATGQYASYGFSCACCEVLNDPKVIGGNIKGKKTGTNTWLVNATVVLGDANSKPTDTLTVNQYFTFTSNP